MRATFALLAGIAGCAVSTSRDSTYQSMLGELRRNERGQAAIDSVVTTAVAARVLDRDAVIDAVLAANRDIESARQAWRATVAAIPNATALDDPMARYALAPLSIGSDAPFGQRIELSQKLPFPGKRSFAGTAAIADAEVMRGELRAAQLAIAELTSQLFDDAWVNARASVIGEQHGILLDQMRKVADARVASGRGSTQDALAAEVELALLERERLTRNTERAVIAARLNGLLHREPAAGLPPPPEDLSVPSAPPMLAELERSALEARPQTSITKAKLAGAAASLQSAERAGSPDFELMASYDSMWDLPEHRWMVSVAIELPLQRRKRAAAVDAARARVAQARATIEQTLDDVRVEVARAHHELTEALAAVTLYDARLVPLARAQVDAAIAGFTTGQNDFSAALEAERRLRDIELAAFRARADAWRRKAALDRTIGRVAGGAR